MKRIITTGLFLAACLSGFSQGAPAETDMYTSASSDILFSKNTNVVKPQDCVGEWVSTGNHLTLFGNQKGVWKDDSHIYTFSWTSEGEYQSNTLRIRISGNDHFKYKYFYVSQSAEGVELVEDQTNLHMHFTKDLTATIQ